MSKTNTSKRRSPRQKGMPSILRRWSGQRKPCGLGNAQRQRRSAGGARSLPLHSSIRKRRTPDTIVAVSGRTEG